MTITQKNLLTWVSDKTPVRYRGCIYHVNYNGLRYFLRPIIGNDCIDFYKKGRGIYGLVTNKTV